MLIFNKQKNKKLFAKIISGFLLSFFVLLISASFVLAQDPPAPIDPTGGTGSTDTNYTLLAPLPGLSTFESANSGPDGCPLSKYLNIMIKIFIGISAVLAMVMIVMGGIEYMTSESISHKDAGKEQATNAVLGLILALAAYAILNTLNPALLNLCPNLPEVKIVVGPEAGDDTVDPEYASGKKIYSTDAAITPSVANAATKLADGWYISKINVYSANNTMQIDMKKGNEFDNNTYLSMAPGLNGYAPVGTAQTKDKKTPLGNWSILSVNYTPNQAQFSQTGSNMGAAFWLLSPMSSGERGIGIHGNKNGTLSATNGCVRLKNSDILALQPYIKTGIPVIIQ